jgi:hypothetical protein
MFNRIIIPVINIHVYVLNIMVDEIKQYEKSLSATKASTCEDLNAYYFNGRTP